MIITGVRLHPERVGTEWPFTLPVVRDVASQGLAFTRPVTFLVGENGSGKSTLIEAIADAYGADNRGGHIGRSYALEAKRSALGAAMHLEFAPRTTLARRPKGFFLRAETAYGVFEFMSNQGVRGYGPRHLLEQSHGESFLQVFDAQFNQAGVFLLDEPESALSFTSCLRLLAVFEELVNSGAQVICATHSPLLASLPDATILELDASGIRETSWADLELVEHWRRYLAAPEQYLRHLLAD